VGQLVNWIFGPFKLEINVAFTGITGKFGIGISFIGYKELIDINGEPVINGIGTGFNIGVSSGFIK